MISDCCGRNGRHCWARRRVSQPPGMKATLATALDETILSFLGTGQPKPLIDLTFGWERSR